MLKCSTVEQNVYSFLLKTFLYKFIQIIYNFSINTNIFVFFNSGTWTVLPQKVRMSAVQQVSLLVLVKLEYFISLLLTVYVEQLLSQHYMTLSLLSQINTTIQKGSN